MVLKFRVNNDSVAYDPNIMGGNEETRKGPQELTTGESKTRKATPHYFQAIATLLGFSDQAGYNVKFCKFEASNGRLKGNRIGIREGMTEQETAFTLAHEIAHAYLHYDKGDTINSSMHEEYEEQADRAACMLLDLVQYMG